MAIHREKRATRVPIATLLICLVLVFVFLNTRAHKVAVIVQKRGSGIAHNVASKLANTVQFTKTSTPMRGDDITSSPCKIGTDDPDRPMHKLRVYQTWNSTKPYRDDVITIVTQLTMPRLNMLQRQCSMWKHRIAAVVYLPLLEGKVLSLEVDSAWNGSTIKQVSDVLSAFHQETEATTDGCTLDLQILVEPFETIQQAVLYPINAVRNKALMFSKTPAIMLLDVDFVPSQSLGESLDTPGFYQELMNLVTRDVALIIPAFEASRNLSAEYGLEVTLDAVKGNKKFVKRAFKNNKMIGFQTDVFPQGHTKTDFSKWLTSREQYQVEYEDGFEPYVVVARKFMPWYDERFLYKERDKVVYLTHLAAKGYRFVVHPSHFVIHVPHEKPVTASVSGVDGFIYQYKTLYRAVKREMYMATFRPVTGFCRSGQFPLNPYIDQQ